MSEPTDGRQSTPLSTQLIHHPYEPPAGFGALQAGRVQGLDGDLSQRGRAAGARLAAARAATPTACTARPPPSRSKSASPRWKAAAHCLLVPSGLAAIALVDIALLKQRRRGADSRQRLRPGQGAGAHELARWGIAHKLLRPDGRRPRWRALIGPRTKLVWLEAPGSITMEFPDLRALVRARAATRRADARWTTPGARAWRFDAFELGDEAWAST